MAVGWRNQGIEWLRAGADPSQLSSSPIGALWTWFQAPGSPVLREGEDDSSTWPPTMVCVLGCRHLAWDRGLSFAMVLGRPQMSGPSSCSLTSWKPYSVHL